MKKDKNYIILAILLIIISSIFAFYPFDKSENDITDNNNNINSESSSIQLDIGDKVNIDNIVKSNDNVKSATFSNSDNFEIDENNNVIAKKSGKDELIVEFDDGTTKKYTIECETEEKKNNNSNVNNGETNNSNTQNTTNNTSNNTNTQNNTSTSTITNYSITLNNNGAKVAGTKTIYEKVIDGKSTKNYYLDVTLNNEMNNIKNTIDTPKKNNYIFNGYYTENNGLGSKVIDENGYLVYNGTFSSSTTLFAYWVADTFIDKINQIRCSKDGKNTYRITTCQSSNDQNSLCNYEEINGSKKNGTVKRNTLTKNNCGYYVNPYTVKIVSASSNDKCKELNDINDGCLISGNITKNETYMQHNTNLLQNIMNKASEYGIKNNIISEVKIPAGEMYFTASEADNNTVINLKSNVQLSGEGEGKTIFKPYVYADEKRKIGNSFYLKNGLSMFYYFVDFENTYLENVKYNNFTIDSSNTRGSNFSVSAKGFAIVLCKNCHWSHVTIKNTDATCFGMDQLINSTIDSCTAIGCGKNAGYDHNKKTVDPKEAAQTAGSSGFGIGFGKSNDEYVVISNSTAKNCAKFGFFYEDQNRFLRTRNIYNANKSKGFIIKNCTAEGNLVNYGGIRAFDVVLYNSKSTKPKAYDVYFTEQSRRIYISNVKVDLESGYSESRKYKDVKKDDYFYDAVKWAQSKGISIGHNESVVLDTKNTNVSGFVDNVYNYSPNTEITRAEAILLLWRSENHPGEVITYKNNNMSSTSGDKTNINTGFSDVDKNASYAGAVKWAKEQGIVSGTSTSTFSPNSKIAKKYFLLMLYRLDGNKSTANEIEKASNWAVSKGIIDNANNIDNNITRKEAITMVYRYYKSTNFKYDSSSYITNIENKLKK